MDDRSTRGRVPRVRGTDAAARALRELAEEHGPLVVVQSAGCCDGSVPMCVPRADFPLGAGDLHVGDVAGVPVYVSARELDAWEHDDVVLDVEPGYAGGLSLPAGPGLHFTTRPDPEGRVSTRR